MSRITGSDLMSKVKFFSGYSRWIDAEGRYESWEEAVQRVVDMHKTKYSKGMSPEVENLLEEAQQAYNNKEILGSQRAFQFGGEQLLRHETRNYNCSASYVDRPAFFQEAMYLLLCGAGVGFSVQRQHIAHLPKLAKRSDTVAKVFVVPDSIEGWADAFGVLLSSYFEDGGTFPEYRGCKVLFDFTKIRPEGAPISGGFKAPGPDGLRQSLHRCEDLLNKALGDEDSVAMRPIVAYDFVMHMADAVLSGGVRRSATICMFSKDDEEMLNAKTGNWFEKNPQRGRSNNSVMLKRDTLTRQEWADIMKSVKSFGEPGFILTDDEDTVYNPCVEIGMYAKDVSVLNALLEAEGKDDPRITSGFQMCNLTEINGGKCTTPEAFYKACRAAAILGTFQAGYTDFKYLSRASQNITERESLLGVSITGWMNNPQVLFDKDVLAKGVEVVRQTNKEVAALLGIPQAARLTCVKPSGNASVLLQTASGIHGEHAPRYIRNVQMNLNEDIAQTLMEEFPKMVEPSKWSATGKDVVVSFPIETPPHSRFKKDLQGVLQLDYVKQAQEFWVNAGTNHELCTRPWLRHNVSNTITVDDWDEVEQYIYDNRDYFAGISLSAEAGDKAYVQAPFTEVLTPEQMVEEYGEAGIFASGLVVDGKHAFKGDLFEACRRAQDFTTSSIEDEEFLVALSKEVEDPLQRDWIRRFHKFAFNFFGGHLQRTEFCLKDSHNLHTWIAISRDLHDVDFTSKLKSQVEVEVNTMGAQACAGGACEINF